VIMDEVIERLSAG